MSDGYRTDFNGDNISVTIAPKPFTLNWTNTNLKYNGNAQKPTATASGLVSGDSATVTVSGERTNVGTYTETATLSNANYTPSKASQAFTIAKNDSANASTLTDARKATAISDLVYNSQNQTLLNAPALPSGYTKVQYSVDGGKTDAGLTVKNAQFNGIVSGDKLTVTAVGKFADANPGADKTVNLSNLTLGGGSVANYHLAADGQQTTAKALHPPSRWT